MGLRGPVPVLYVTDIELIATCSGFHCASGLAGWACLERDRAEIMVSLPNEHLPFEKPVFTGSFYFHVEDVDTLWEHLRDKVTVVYPIENFDYGMREFAIRDVNGYILQFGREIASP